MDDQRFSNTNILAHIHDPKEHELPSMSFSPMKFLGIFLAFVVLAGMIGMVIIFVSRTQERRKAAVSKKNETKAKESLKKNIECRPWSDCGDDTVEMTDDSFAMHNVSTSSESDNSYSSDIAPFSRSTTSSRDLECGSKGKSGCALCSQAYESGQPVYKSNNPHCQHEFHMVCMDKWLDIQNTCPTCNQPYILQTV